MKAVILALSLAAAVAPVNRSTPERALVPHTQLARNMTCFKSGEESPPGFTKICYYDCMGSRVAITISSTSLCPLTIQR
jgi:hypothetical protein